MKEKIEENMRQPRALLAGRLMALITLHRDALLGLVDITVVEFVEMQREMSNIAFQLNNMPASHGNQFENADGFAREDKLNVNGPEESGCNWKLLTSAS